MQSLDQSAAVPRTLRFPRSLAAQYEPECVIGEGGFGVVYRAQQLTLKRTVAVKLVRTHQLANDRFRESFLREARVMARVSEDAVIPVLDHGIADGVPYIIMPFLPGPSLGDVLEAGPLPWRDVVRHAIRVAQGLQALHLAGIVHRDLKPSNVLLNDSGEAVLTDFGLSKAVGLRSQTYTGMLVGTPGYVAPERMDGHAEIPESDLYSLGVMLWALLVGTRPFQASCETAHTGQEPMPEMVAASVKSPPPFPAERVDVPAALVSLIRRLLSMNPGARARDAQQVVKELELIASSGMRSETRTTERPRRSRSRRPAARRSVPWFLQLLPKLALGTVVLSVLLLLRGRRPVPLPPVPPSPQHAARPAPKQKVAHILDIGVARELAERLSRRRDLPLVPLGKKNGTMLCPLVLTREAQLGDIQLSLSSGLRLLSVNGLPPDVEASVPYRIGLNWLQIDGKTQAPDCGTVTIATPFRATDIRPVKECPEELLRDRIVVRSSVMYDWSAAAMSKALHLIDDSVKRARPAYVGLLRTMMATYMMAQGSRGPTFNPYVGQVWADPEVLAASEATLEAVTLALQENSASWEAWHDLGWVLCHRGQLTMGKLALCQSLVYGPDSHWSWWELSTAYAIAWQDPACPPARREEYRREALACVERARRYLGRKEEGSRSSAMESTLDAGYTLLSGSATE